MKKVMVVTGASTGVGKEIAFGLAKEGHTVVMVSRDPARAAAALAYVKGAAPGAEAHSLTGDLSLLFDVRRIAAELKSRFPRIDVLINNAGMIPVTRVVTKENLEAGFVTNTLAPFLLDRLLFDTLKASAPARIINFYGGNTKALDLENLQSDRGSFGGFDAYGRAKNALAALTFELARRYERTGVTVNGVVPGVVNTEGMRAIPGFFGFLMMLMRPFQRTPQEGAAAPIWVATAPELATTTGKYFGSVSGDWKKELPVPPITHDPAIGKKLFELCEQLAPLS